MASSDVEHWQCDKSLQQCLAHMLNNQIMCDVTFLIGEEPYEVHAHRCILASRSPVFHAMLNGPMAEQGKIKITDIDHEIFQLFLEYVYTDEICLKIENVMRIMYVAKKYCVDRLTSKCKQFVQKNINSNNACKLMDEAVKFSDEDIRQSCLQKIKEDTEACIQSQEFINICNESLELITKLEKITMKEESLYEQVIKWCDAECDRQQLAVTWLNKRNVLGDLRFNIRFPAMEARYFAERVASTDLLTSEEKVEIFMYHTLGRQGDLKYFSKNREKRKENFSDFYHSVDVEDSCHEKVNVLDPFHDDVDGLDPFHDDVDALDPFHGDVDGLDPFHDDVDALDPFHDDVDGLDPFYDDVDGLNPLCYDDVDVSDLKSF